MPKTGPKTQSSPATPSATVQVELQFQQALGHCRRGEFAHAQALCRQIIAARPAHVDALHLLGLIAVQERDFPRAITILGKVIKLDPGNAPAMINRGSAYRELKRYDAALVSYDRAIAVDSSLTEAHYNRAVVLQELGRSREALESCDRAVAGNTGMCEAHRFRGRLLRVAGRPEDAADAFKQAILLDPMKADTHVELGDVLSELRQFDSALGCYERALALDASLAVAALGRGNALFEQMRLLEALAAYDRVIALKPDYAAAFNNRGNVLREMRRLDEALASYDRAIALRYDLATTHCNRANVLAELEQFEPARESYANAIAIDPNHADAYCNLALMQLRAGDFTRGWANFEWRHRRAAQSPRRFIERRWSGTESIAGKRILLRCEQGLGDTIQFCRFASVVAGLQAQVLLEVQRPLLTLLAGLRGVVQIVEEGTEAEFDYQCPLMSLPLALNSQLSTIPSFDRYLWTDPEKVAAWETMLGTKAKPRIGLCWSGSRNQRADQRSLPLEELVPHLSSRFQFVSLQRDVSDRQAQLLAASPHVMHFGAEHHEFSNTAALCECMDLVITIDTNIAHLSGAVGRRTWVLLGQNPDWRWLTDREDSPWYPTLRLFRQGASNGWEEMLTRVFTQLEFTPGTAGE